MSDPTRIVANWALCLPDVLLAFPHASPSELLASRGDRRIVVAHLAHTHDLTLAEAREGLDDAVLRAESLVMTKRMRAA